MVQYIDFLTPINLPKPKNGAALLTMLLALVMMGGALHMAMPTRAADLVCGDENKEAPEECDDGNLRNGDGCSNTCTIELCGNRTVDIREQCDDGNLQNNDGCNRYCQIEFCGDRVVQAASGETCDDGNGIAGDGCTGDCTLEGAPDLAVVSSSSSSSSSLAKPYEPPAPAAVRPPPPPKPLPPPPISPLLVRDVIQAELFLSTEAGQDYKNYLTVEQVVQLEIIVNKIADSTRLNEEEKVWAVELYVALTEARIKERTRYTDLLKQFISTAISTDVVAEKDLEKSNLVDVEVPIAIDELGTAVGVISRGELKDAVTANVSRLTYQGIDFLKDTPTDFENYLTPGSRPISVFATLKTLKEAAETYATNDVGASLQIVRTEANALRSALPILEQEYGVKSEDAEALLIAIENVSADATKQDLERVIAAINLFLESLDKNKVLTNVDTAYLESNLTHTAAAATRIAEVVGLRGQVTSTDDVGPFLDALAATAPEVIKDSFETGTVIDQRKALVEFLTQNERITELRDLLRKDGRQDFDTRFDVLLTEISEVGDLADNATICDDSLPESLHCADEFFADLQEAARGRSIFTRLIGTLQDYFGIGS